MQKEVRLLALLRLSVQDSDPHGQRSSDNHLHDLLSVLRMSSLPPDLHTISHDLSVHPQIRLFYRTDIHPYNLFL